MVGQLPKTHNNVQFQHLDSDFSQILSEKLPSSASKYKISNIL